MALPEGVHTLAGRTATFETPFQLPKQRASGTKKGAKTTVSWPHAELSPEELARAGFFYRPEHDKLDNTQCFMCFVQIVDWEPTDIPSVEHLKCQPACGWAINSDIGNRLALGEEVDHDPMAEEFLEARKDTFTDAWPHEQKKGWKCKIAKMASAGWCYDPSPEYEDGATCFYCGLSLDGWEPKDDPVKEHKQRRPDCVFFELTEKYRNQKRTKGRKGSISRTARQSSQSVTFAEAPSYISIGDSSVAADDSIMTTATTASGTKRKAKAAAKPRAKRAKKATAEESSIANFSQDEEMNEAPEPKKRTRRGKATVDDSVMDDEASIIEPKKTTRRGKAMIDDSAVNVEASIIEPKKSVRRGKATIDDSAMDVEASVIITQEKPKRQTRRGKTTIDDSVMDGVESVQGDIEPPKKQIRRGKAAADNSVMTIEEPVEAPKKQTRRKKGALDDSVADNGYAMEEVIAPPKKQTRGKKQIDDSVMADADVVQETTELPKKQTRKASRTQKPSALEDWVMDQEPQEPPSNGARNRLSEDESQLHLELQRAVENSLVSASTPTMTPAKRGTKRTSDGATKLQSVEQSVIIIENSHVQVEVEVEEPKPKRARKTKKAAEEASTAQEGAGHPIVEVAKPAPKGRKAKKPAKAPSPEPVPEPEFEPEPVLATPEQYHEPLISSVRMPLSELSAPERESTPSQVLQGQDENEIPEHYMVAAPTPPNHATPVPSDTDSPLPEELATPTPIRRRDAPGTSASYAESLRSLGNRLFTPGKGFRPGTQLTPGERFTPINQDSLSISPQSSNAENRPPPEVYSSPGKDSPTANRGLGAIPDLMPGTVTRVPLRSTTPQQSPSRRNVAKSVVPWSPADIETVLAAGGSPLKMRLLGDHAAEDHEQNEEGAVYGVPDDVELDDMEPEELEDVVERILEEMGPDQHDMTVAEWLRYNASHSAGNLRSRCEAMVRVFRAEGERAKASLEGIQTGDE
ncbi:hypothetical protein EJ06DRAFT_579828 [Trichodelitschia bisporula]|uniref:BIR-domain-containing protein n=1 Tax=Trichodelitschia bisporula TaxID=703511 RepID=A0A6G1I6M3_9PEZI|nr:hypothetical protein EJ06DRAFT_579828 [Trichodelitschia bisporula]